MYQEIQSTKKLPKEEAITKLEQIEAQIHINISEIKSNTFVSVASLDSESRKSIHKMLLKEVERVRKLILNNEM